MVAHFTRWYVSDQTSQPQIWDKHQTFYKDHEATHTKHTPFAAVCVVNCSAYYSLTLTKLKERGYLPVICFLSAPHTHIHMRMHAFHQGTHQLLTLRSILEHLQSSHVFCLLSETRENPSKGLFYTQRPQAHPLLSSLHTSSFKITERFSKPAL